MFDEIKENEVNVNGSFGFNKNMQISLVNTRQNYKLSLRKERMHKNFLKQRIASTIQSSKSYEVIPPKLNIDPSLQYDFRLNINNLKTNLPITITYLRSTEIDYIKFGAFLLRRFFQELPDTTNSEPTHIIYLNEFLSINIFQEIEFILSKQNDLFIISELLWVLQNITYYLSNLNDPSLFLQLCSNNYISIYKNLFLLQSGEVVGDLFGILINICLSNRNALAILYNNAILKPILYRFSSTIINDYELENSIQFMYLLTSISFSFTPNEIEQVYHLLNTVISQSNEINIIVYALKGICRLLQSDNNQRFMIVFDLIYKTNLITIVMKFFDYEHMQYINILYEIISILNYICSNLPKDKLEMFIRKYNLLDYIFDLLTLKCPNYNSIQEVIKIIKVLTSKDVEMNFIREIIHHKCMKYLIEQAYSHSDFCVRDLCIDVFLDILRTNNDDVLYEMFNLGCVNVLVSKVLVDEQDGNILKKGIECLYYFIYSTKGDVFIKKVKELGGEDVLGKIQANIVTNENDELDKVIEKVKRMLI